MSHDLHAAYQEAKQIALTGYRNFELHNDRWLWCFDVPYLHVVAPRNASPSELAVLIVEQSAIHRAQQATDWATSALAGVALIDMPPAGSVQ